jgi:hypothetical protein
MNKWENVKDIGIKPSHGLAVPKLSVKEASFADKGTSDAATSCEVTTL